MNKQEVFDYLKENLKIVSYLHEYYDGDKRLEIFLNLRDPSGNMQVISETNEYFIN